MLIQHCFAQSKALSGDNLSAGEKLFKENNAKDAVEVLEYEILQGQVSENTYNFLGLGYYQLGDYEKSIEAFRRGINKQPENKKLFTYNLGNTYYALKDYENAVEMYSQSLQVDPLFYEAILNRANALLMADRLVSAKEDYELYIEKRPDDVQHERIELLIQALEQEIARREEEARLLAEQNKAVWEEYDASLGEKQKEGYNPDWEEIENPLADGRTEEEKAEWERIHSTEPLPQLTKKTADVVDDNSSADSWESFSGESELPKIKEPVAKTEEKQNWESFSAEETPSIADRGISGEAFEDNDWQDFSDSELEEMKALEEESRIEREKWLADKKRQEEEKAAREYELKMKEYQKSLDDEKRFKEQLLEEMRQEEEERRKKLLEDVANSLQNTESTNLTSGAEDLLDYDLEGELD